MPDVRFPLMFRGAAAIEGRYTLPKLHWDDGEGTGHKNAQPGDKVHSLDEMKEIFAAKLERGDPLLVSGVGMDWPMMEWDSFEDMANVVAPKLSSGSRNVHPWPDALSPEDSDAFRKWREAGNELSFDNFREVQLRWPHLYWSFASNTKDELDALDDQFDLPPFIPPDRVSPGKPGWVYAGNPGSGVGWHIDTIGCVCSWAVLLHGRKRWYLRSPPGTPSEQIREYKFIQEPGDMIFWCAGWFHQTSILEESLDIHGYVHLNSFAPPQSGIMNAKPHRASEYVGNLSMWIDAIDFGETEFTNWHSSRKPMHVLAGDCGVEVAGIPDNRGDPPKKAPTDYERDEVSATPVHNAGRRGRPGNYNEGREQQQKQRAPVPQPRRDTRPQQGGASDNRYNNGGGESSRFGGGNQGSGNGGNRYRNGDGNRNGNGDGSGEAIGSGIISNNQCQTPTGAIVCELMPVLIFNGVLVLAFILALCGICGIVGANPGQGKKQAGKGRRRRRDEDEEREDEEEKEKGEENEEEEEEDRGKRKLSETKNGRSRHANKPARDKKKD